jgi:hypothetical protein
MWHIPNAWRFRADAPAPETYVAQAGCALACAFASSEEFEAAIIRAKRAAGVYGPKRHRHQLAAAAIHATILVALIVWLV